ncbi:MAG TPA: S41 family peptidase [Acidobacteriota bacterium]
MGFFRSNTQSKLRPAALAALVAFSALLLSAAVPGQAARPQLDRGLETFDQAWQIIAETHFDPEFNGVDWNAVREELRPRAATAASTGELRSVIKEMLSRLDQSHFALWPRESLAGLAPAPGETAAGNGEAGFQATLVGEQFVVSHVAAGGPAAAAGIRPGWVVRRVGGVEVGDQLDALLEQVEEHKARVEAQRGIKRMLSGSPASELEIDFFDAADAPVTVSLPLQRPAGQLSQFGNLPPMPAALDSEIVRPDVALSVGVIRFNIWLPVLARPFDEAIDTMRDADGVVLDLRGNPGGLGAMVMGIGGHFVEEHVALGTMKMRDSELHFVANPRRIDTSGARVAPFAGPLAILIDNTSASTSEVFAGGMQAIGRARVFGQRSMGAVLPSLMDELPNGDILQHAFADFVISDGGVRLEGRGVFPDEHVAVSRADLLAGRDPALEGAVEWIVRQQAEQTLPEPAEIIARHVEAIGGRSVVEARTSSRVSGRLEIVGQGLIGEMTVHSAAPDKSLLIVGFPQAGVESRVGYDGSVGWSMDSLMGERLLQGGELRQIADEADFYADLHGPENFTSMQTIERTEFAGRPAYKVKLVYTSGREVLEYFDVESGLLIGTEGVQESLMGSINVVTEVHDYQGFGDLLVATRIIQQIGPGQSVVATIEDVEFDNVDPAIFELPAAIKALIGGAEAALR